LLGISLDRRDHAAQASLLAEMAHDRAGVDVRDHGDAVALEIFFGDFLGAPVGADFGELADHQALDVRTRGLLIVRIGTVISYFWIGKDYALPCVRRVSKDFLIAG